MVRGAMQRYIRTLRMNKFSIHGRVGVETSRTAPYKCQQRKGELKKNFAENVFPTARALIGYFKVT